MKVWGHYFPRTRSLATSSFSKILRFCSRQNKRNPSHYFRHLSQWLAFWTKSLEFHFRWPQNFTLLLKRQILVLNVLFQCLFLVLSCQQSLFCRYSCFSFRRHQIKFHINGTTVWGLYLLWGRTWPTWHSVFFETSQIASRIMHYVTTTATHPRIEWFVPISSSYFVDPALAFSQTVELLRNFLGSLRKQF